MLTKRIYPIVFFCLMLHTTVLAQLDFRLTSAFGNMSLHPETDLNIDVETSKFLTVGFQADYYFTDRFGFGIGADYYVQDYNFDVILHDYNNNYHGIDNWAGDPVPREYDFFIRSNSPDIIEQNTMSFFDIPVSFVYTVPIIDNLYLATRLGVKAGLPLNGNYVLKESDLYTRLYFEEWDLELFNIPAHGLYDSRTDWHPEDELSLNPVYSIFSEIGLDFPLSYLKVRVSGYFSYSLNSVMSETQNSLIYWREDYNNILSLPDDVRMMQIGIKIGVGIISYKEKKTKYKHVKLCPAYM